MRALKVPLILLLALILLSCASSFTKNAFDSLSISKETYSSTLSISGDLYKQGLMSEEQKNEAIKLGNAYKLVHNEAVSALLNYKMLKDQNSKDLYLQSAADVSARLANLLNYLRPIVIKKED